MARTALFARTARRMRAARHLLGAPSVPRALSRRQAIILAAAGAALGACATASRRRAKTDEPVAIVGGGAAGLVVAYRLVQAGRKVTLYESTNRLGGRMFTQKNFTAEGLFCELGGELVDTGHQELIALAGELGIKIQRLAPEDRPDEDIYDVGGRLFRARDFLDPKTGTGAFLPLAEKIARDQAALLDAEDNWTDRARALDSTSLADYLAALRPLTDRWATDALALAYHAEYGIPIERQSALNLVDFIGAEASQEFALFGDSDELFRVEGGSSTLTDALVAAIAGAAEIRRGMTLTRIDDADGRFLLGFNDDAETVLAERAVLAIPFTRLREANGIDAIGLSGAKLGAIRALGYGDNAKIMTATRARPWKEPSANGFSFTGAVYSDRGFDIVWDASRGQDGAGGVLTNFLASTPDESGLRARIDALEQGLSALNPAIGETLDGRRRAVMLWGRHPQIMGSYAGPLIGQYTTLIEETAAPECGGRLHFAGEHTSVNFMGFMNGAVESGERVAREIADS